MRRIENLRACLVIEVEPWGYGPDGKCSPERPAKDSAEWRAFVETWDQYVADCFAHSGIHNLPTIGEGAWHVRVADIDRAAAAPILRRHLEVDDYEDGCDLDDCLAAFSGGVALFDGDTLLSEPQCCSGLWGLKGDWLGAVDERSPDWKMLWNGHPWNYIRVLEDRVELHVPEDEVPNDYVPASANYTFEATVFESALRGLETEQRAFESVLRPTVDEVDLVAGLPDKDKQRLVAILSGRRKIPCDPSKS